MTRADTAIERIGGYRVVRRLATGGTSDVLLAKAEGPHGFERTVVLKVLLSQFRRDDETARMFAREASAYARLAHPSIVRLFDFFAVPAGESAKSVDRAGQLVMVLEHVDGPPLARLKSMVRAVGKELDDRASIYIAARVFDALAAAHAALDDAGLMAPVIHRDVNPSNVLVPWDGHVKLADFGIAKVTGLNHQSAAGLIKGTYGYMAPEQVLGDAVTPRADVYAGAIILWELLTKRRAFQRGALPEVEALRAMAEPRLPALESIRSDVDRSVREALKRALEPRTERRKITAEEMVAILSEVVPPNEGRERLVALLGMVRNDSRAANASASVAPPAPSGPIDVVIPPAPKTVQGVGPNAAGRAPPRPLSSGRLPVAGRLPEPAGPLPTRPALPAVKVNAPKVGPISRPALPAAMLRTSPSADTAPLSSDPTRRQSAASRLAVSVPDPRREVEDAAPPNTVSLFDSLIEPPVHRGEPASDPTPPSARELTGGLGFGSAIDEVLRAVPATNPPDVSRETTRVPPIESLVEETSVSEGQRPIGQLPAAPPPMGPVNEPLSSPEPFGAPPTALVTVPTKTVAMRIPSSPPAVLHDDAVTTPRMAARTGGQTVAMDVRPMLASPSGPPGAESTKPPGPAAGAGLMQPFVLPSIPAAANVPSIPSSPPAVLAPPHHGSYHDLPPMIPGVAGPRRSGVSATAIGVALLAVVAVGIAGTVGYVRYEATRADPSSVATQTASTPLASTGATPPSAVAVTDPASAAPSTDVAPHASTAPAASAAPPTTTAAADADVTVASAEAGAAIPAGMGALKTTGAIGGRRIFVDEKVLGQTPETVTVTCGTHTVRLGSSGKPQTIEVPCGSEITVADKL